MRYGPLSRCRRCQTPIAFARLGSGKVMPVQPHFVAGGNVAVHRDRADALVARVLVRDERERSFEETTVHHRVMCPAEAEERHETSQQMSLLDAPAVV